MLYGTVNLVWLTVTGRINISDSQRRATLLVFFPVNKSYALKLLIFLSETLFFCGYLATLAVSCNRLCLFLFCERKEDWKSQEVSKSVPFLKQDKRIMSICINLPFKIILFFTVRTTLSFCLLCFFSHLLHQSCLTGKGKFMNFWICFMFHYFRQCVFKCYRE